MFEQLLFPKLFESAKIGKLKVRNRLVMLPMGTAYASPSGEVTQRTIDHFIGRAKGGAGIITVGNISPNSPNGLNQLALDSDRVMMGHYELAEKVHAEGAKIIAQLNHPGRQKYAEILQPGEDRVSSSPLPMTFMGQTYPPARELRKDEIYQIIQTFVRSSERAKQVGYDGVEFHGAHGYLINQFISPFMNARKDEYGGTLENRMRFPLELIEATRRAIGPEFPVGIRISAEEFVSGGITLKESTVIAQTLEAAGVAYISVSGGVFETGYKSQDLMRDPEGWKEYLWEGIEKAVKVPVITGGGLRHPDFCERLLEEGKADLIGLARPLLADPEWPMKAKEGRIEDIRMCISCNECIYGSRRRRYGGGARRCAVNAAHGCDREFAEVMPTSDVKNVMVIGGGPAGMEAARIAALRGHKVTLYEKREALGGQLLLAGKPQTKRRVLWFRDYLVAQLKKLNVEVVFGVEVTPRLVEEIKPNAVVVATGAEPILPDIPGIRNQRVVSAWEVLNDTVKLQNERVAVVGGGIIGCEIAEYLLESKNKVAIIEQLPALAPDMEPFHRFVMIELFKENNVSMLTGRKVLGIGNKGIQVINLENGKEELIEADWSVIAVGTKPVDSLTSALDDKSSRIYSVGDCNQPRVII